MGRRFPPGSAECRRDGGFALIIVLWTLVLIGFIVAHLTASGRTEIRIAGNLVANSASQAAADGAIFEAVFSLSDPQPEQRWPVDGTPRQVIVGSSRVIVRLEDEASWINPSTASPVLLEALLRVTRTAVVRTAGTLPQGYAVLAWGTSLNSDAPLGLPPPPVTR